MLDSDNDGKISKKDVVAAYTEFKKQDINPPTVEEFEKNLPPFEFPIPVVLKFLGDGKDAVGDAYYSKNVWATAQ